MFDFLGIISNILSELYFIGGFLLSLWWIWLPWILFVLAKDIWIRYRRNKFVQELEWVLLEVKPPQNIEKTPYAMEQLFAGLHGVHSDPNKKEQLYDGIFQRYFSFEMISQGGKIHFLVRTVKFFRDLVESQIYAQYPEAEITQVDDYVNLVPDDIPNEEYNLWGTEFILTNPDAYPIRTYLEFDKDAKTDEQRIDSLSSLLEIMSKLKNREQIWIQTLIRPVDDTWKKEGEKLKDQLLGRKEEKKEGLIIKEIVGWKDAIKAVTHQIITGDILEGGEENKKNETETPFLWKSSKGEQEIITAIEGNISKIGYETIIRFVYFAPRDVFTMANVSGVVGSFKQFNTQDLNGFKPNNKISPSAPDYHWQFKDTRASYRRKRVFKDYQKRYFVQYSDVISYLNKLSFEKLPILNWFFIRSKPFVFNIEELATIYHYPTLPVKVPLVPKVDSRKSEPPMGLPIQ